MALLVRNDLQVCQVCPSRLCARLPLWVLRKRLALSRADEICIIESWNCGMSNVAGSLAVVQDQRAAERRRRKANEAAESRRDEVARNMIISCECFLLVRNRKVEEFLIAAGDISSGSSSSIKRPHKRARQTQLCVFSCHLRCKRNFVNVAARAQKPAASSKFRTSRVQTFEDERKTRKSHASPKASEKERKSAALVS